MDKEFELDEEEELHIYLGNDEKISINVRFIIKK